MNDNIILSIKNVTKKYGNRIVVKNLSFDVFRGEIFGFLGPNGAGKTTTIKMITGLAKIDEGDIFICGKSIKNDFENAIINLGGVIENPEMYLNMSGLENLKYYAALYKGITKDKIYEIVDLVGLTSRINDKIKTYSLGMKQRLGIAQALLHEPKLLVLDEPTNGLDPEAIVELRKFLKKLAVNKKMAILVSSHNLGEMSLMCNTIAILNHGVLGKITTINSIESNNQQKKHVSIKVNFPNYAGKLIKQQYNIDKVSIVKNVLTFDILENEVPSINAFLVKNGIQIYFIEAEKENLEDMFLETINKRALPQPKGDRK